MSQNTYPQTPSPVIDRTLTLAPIPTAFYLLPSMVSVTHRRVCRAKRRLARLAAQAPATYRYQLKVGQESVCTWQGQQPG